MNFLMTLSARFSEPFRAPRRWLVALFATGAFLFGGCVPADPGMEETVTQRRLPDFQPGEVTTFPRDFPEGVLRERRFSEAPKLAERSRRGELPPVGDRLPVDPLMVFPIHEIGVYGGDLRRASSADVAFENAIRRTMSENLLGWERPLPNSLELNLAKHYEFKDDGRRIRLWLREGIRWSDGHPFTVDDILFLYEDMMLDEQARQQTNPFFPYEWTQDGEPLRMIKVDDYCLDIVGTRPLGRILEVLTADIIAYPKHYFAPHHPRYNPGATYADFRLLTTDARLTYEPGVPRITAWKPVEWHKGQRVIYERNPYYWKVDPEGNQLPYADRLVLLVIPNAEIRLFKFINGEFDILGDIPLGNAYPTLRAYEPAGRYSVHYTPPRPFYALVLNWDTPRPALREAFRNRNVRIALSHAVNREEINQLLGLGLITASGFALGPDSPYFDEDHFYRYATFDPEKSKQLLDAEGYTDRNGDGYRQFPDGSRFELTIDLVTDRGIGAAFLELVVEYLEAIGIRTFLNMGHNNIIMERRNNATFEILARRQPSHLFDQSQHYAVVGPNLPFWHPRAVESETAWLLQATEYLQNAMGTVDPAVRDHYARKVHDLHVENIPMISLGSQREVYAANRRIGNVPPVAVLDTSYRGWERPIFHEQLFVRPGVRP